MKITKIKTKTDGRKTVFVDHCGNLTQQSQLMTITSSAAAGGSHVGFIFLGGGPGGLSSSSSLSEPGSDLVLREGRFRTMAWPMTLEVPGSGSSFLILMGRVAP